MKKMIFAVFISLMLLIVACSKPATKPIPPASNPITPVSPTIQSDNSVDVVGNSIADVDQVDDELNEDDSQEIDSGLSDIESI